MKLDFAAFRFYLFWKEKGSNDKKISPNQDTGISFHKMSETNFLSVLDRCKQANGIAVLLLAMSIF